jgi:ribosomal protein S18 acetylase RimI-like enzyme
MKDSDWLFIKRGLSETNWEDLPQDQKAILTREDSDRLIAEDFQRYLRNEQFKFKVFVATAEKDTPVGYVSVGELRNPAVGIPMGGIMDLWVDPTLQRKGIGQTLLHYALDYVASQGYSHSSILVSARNAATRRLYEKSGFYVDRLIMAKPIEKR